MKSTVRNDRPLCVDLDGTLLKTDLLIESLLVFVKQNPFNIFLAMVWLFRGKAAFKEKIAARVELDVATLPYNQNFLDYVREQAKRGRRVILATASNEKFAQAVAAHLGIFDGVMASNAQVNLGGKRKAETLVKALGEKGFDYAGNANTDVPVWAQARNAILVNPAAKAARAAESLGNISRIFVERCDEIKAVFTAMRPYQWSKNLLIFVPLLASHQLNNMSLLWNAVVAFFAFSVCASSVYLLNDLLDVAADRAHPRKKERPFASGKLPLVYGLAFVPVLLGAAVLITLDLPVEFTGFLGIYFLITVTYSLFLKRVPIVDVLVLAALYIIRILSGSAAVGVITSFWLLAFSMFIFLSLAFAKRCAELFVLQQSKRVKTVGRGYGTHDLNQLNSMGIASGYLSVLVLALYINSSDVMILYPTAEILWLVCPILLYWVSRIWLKVDRGEMEDDPIVFTFRDWASRICGITIVALVGLATFFS